MKTFTARIEQRTAQGRFITEHDVEVEAQNQTLAGLLMLSEIRLFAKRVGGQPNQCSIHDVDPAVLDVIFNHLQPEQAAEGGKS